MKKIFLTTMIISVTGLCFLAHAQVTFLATTAFSKALKLIPDNKLNKKVSLNYTDYNPLNKIKSGGHISKVNGFRFAQALIDNNDECEILLKNGRNIINCRDGVIIIDYDPVNNAWVMDYKEHQVAVMEKSKMIRAFSKKGESKPGLDMTTVAKL